MKVLTYGMQSSGASLFTYFLGQNPDSVVIIDLFNKNIAPKIRQDLENDVYMKTVITNAFSFEEHCYLFEPDKTILFVRNPFDNYVSLLNKSWKDERGSIDEKFKILNNYYKNNEKFDTVIYYEDLINDVSAVVDKLNKIGVEFKVDNKRTLLDMAKFNNEKLPVYCSNPNEYYQKGKFSSGGIRDDKIDIKYFKKPINYGLKKKVAKLCPSLLNLYGGEYA